TDENYPNHVSKPEETAALLAEVVDMKKEDIQKEIEENIKKGQFQMELGQAGRNISYNDKKFLEESEATGISFVPETRRFYPNGQFSSHLFGFADLSDDIGALDGQLGFERIYNDHLTGEPGSVDYSQDVWGYMVTNSDNVKPPVDGHDVK